MQIFKLNHIKLKEIAKLIKSNANHVLNYSKKSATQIEDSKQEVINLVERREIRVINVWMLLFIFLGVEIGIGESHRIAIRRINCNEDFAIRDAVDIDSIREMNCCHLEINIIAFTIIFIYQFPLV